MLAPLRGRISCSAVRITATRRSLEVCRYLLPVASQDFGFIGRFCANLLAFIEPDSTDFSGFSAMCFENRRLRLIIIQAIAVYPVAQ